MTNILFICLLSVVNLAWAHHTVVVQMQHSAKAKVILGPNESINLELVAFSGGNNAWYSLGLKGEKLRLTLKTSHKIYPKKIHHLKYQLMTFVPQARALFEIENHEDQEKQVDVFFSVDGKMLYQDMGVIYHHHVRGSREGAYLHTQINRNNVHSYLKLIQCKEMPLFQQDSLSTAALHAFNQLMGMVNDLKSHLNNNPPLTSADLATYRAIVNVVKADMQSLDVEEMVSFSGMLEHLEKLFVLCEANLPKETLQINRFPSLLNRTGQLFIEPVVVWKPNSPLHGETIEAADKATESESVPRYYPNQKLASIIEYINQHPSSSKADLLDNMLICSPISQTCIEDPQIFPSGYSLSKCEVCQMTKDFGIKDLYRRGCFYQPHEIVPNRRLDRFIRDDLKA